MDAAILEQLVLAGRDFYQRGWMLATAGNLSTRVERDPLRYAITASGGHKGALTPGDFIALGAGMSRPSTSRKPSAETVVHDLLYRRVECACILHVHAPYMTLVARHWLGAQAVDVSGFEFVKALGFWDRDASVQIPIVPNHHDLSELAAAVADAAGSVPAVLVAGHGVYAWGATVPDARRHVEAVEFLCQMVWEELRAGLRSTP